MIEDVSGFFNYLEIQRHLPRYGPGNELCTRRALASVPSLSDRVQVLDIGFGNGVQTIELARQMPNAQITALDIYDPSTSKLPERLAASTNNRISIQQGPLLLEEFPDHVFDLIWCETAVLTLGLADCLRSWRRVLTADGCVGFIDICWLSESRPTQASEFWRARYPEMKSLREVLECLEENGYLCLNSFILPEHAWWSEFLTPLDESLNQLKMREGVNVESLFEADLRLIELCRDKANSFGAVFFTATPLYH